MHDDQGLGTSFFKGHRGDGPIFATFVIRPDEAGVRHHFVVPTEERHALRRVRVAEHQTVRAPDANIHFAGKQGQAKRLRYPPPLEQLGFGPGFEHDASRPVEGSHHDELTIGLSFHRRAVLHGCGLTFSFCVHRPSPSVSVPRQPCPARRSVRPRADGTSRSMPPLPRVGTARACRSVRARTSQ